MLAPLTNITSRKVKFKWTDIKKDAFSKIKRIVARDTLLSYPDFNEKLKIHTDARDSQLGAVTIQKGKLISLYSTIFTETQKKVYSSRKGYVNHD